MTKKIIFDPIKIHESKLGSVEMIALNAFLKSKHIDDMWLMNREYAFKLGTTQYIFCFTKTLLRRQRKEGKVGERFEVFNTSDTPLGEGGYATVYPILGTIKFEANKPILKAGKNRIVKIEQHDKYDRSNSVLKEYNNLIRAGHLGVKPPVFVDNGGKKSLLVMKQAEGFTLEKILNPNKRHGIINLIPKLSIEKRLEITFAILNAVKEQVIDKGMVHRDLKPGNIMIDLSKFPPKVTIIDYGVAIVGELQENRRVGTTAYRAPEIYLGTPAYTTKSDTYAVGRILSYLWGDDYQNYYMPHKISLDQIKKKSTNKNLFSDPQVVLFKKDQVQIRQCLGDLLNENPSERSSLDEVMKQFLKIDRRKYQIFEHFSKNKLAKLEEQIQAIYLLLSKLSEKGNELKQRGFTDAGKKAAELAKNLKNYTEILEKTPDSKQFKDYRSACYKEINASKMLLQTHRDSRWLIAEIVTAVSLLGIGYLLAVGVNYQVTGRFGLFTQTKSDQIVEEIRSTIYQISDEGCY